MFYAVGEEAPTSGAGDFLQSDPAPPNFWEDSQTVSKVPLKETGETFSRVETQKVSFHDAVAFDPMWAAILDPGFTLPTPAPPPSAPVQAAGALTEAQLREVLSQAGWPEHLHGEALRIIHCESRGKPDANNGIDKGLFQMNFSERATLRGSWFAYFGVDESLWADPVTNATVARWAYELSGWPKWSCAALVGLY